MKNTPNLITIFILTILVALGSLVLSTDQARAGFTTCDIGIEKDADPQDDTPFDFTAPGSDSPNFTLRDPSSNSINLEIDSQPPNSLTVTEIVPPGWVLEDVVCDEPESVLIGPFENNGITFQCVQMSSFGSANCTFINSRNICRITVQKTANPPDDTPFGFTAPGSDNPNFTLMDPSDSSIDIEIETGQMTTVTEEIPLGWQLDGIECTDVPGVEVTDTPNGVNIDCVSAGAISCNFTNSIPPRPIPTLSEWGLIAMAGVLGIIGLLALRRRKAAV